LKGLQQQLDTQVSFFKKEIAGAKKYQQQLQGQIAALSAQQQAILAQKSGTFQTTVGDVPLADDFNASPAFNPGFSPAFAVFSFGAPHFNGLSQYGAFGRAKEGQNAETILHAYYGDVEVKKDYDQNANICVGSSRSNCQNISLETYAKRIYEVPSVWGDDGGMEALKAQAVAARSYALADMARRGYICSTESCQVYKSSNKGGKWEEAVNGTAGWVLMKNGKPVWAKYASTAGGYIDSYTDTASSGLTTPSFWDTKNGRDGWTNQAFEKIAGSPWFYKAWYRFRNGDSCGRSHPWLTQDEMGDILNAWRVLQQGSDSRISPLGGCWGGNPYSIDELRNKANGAGGAVTSVSSVTVEYSNDGYTATVRFSTNQGDISLSGADFKKIYNLRAPGRISIKSGLFNIEKR
ncbi:MAG TPA: SpoIID/LytB domain-containing protein, partial [Patescibacteria group bacterium]|nr:SpoIID/LytB domain-containing protein [Patescibacteria group bacterium]